MRATVSKSEGSRASSAVGGGDGPGARSCDGLGLELKEGTHSNINVNKSLPFNLASVRLEPGHITTQHSETDSDSNNSKTATNTRHDSNLNFRSLFEMSETTNGNLEHLPEKCHRAQATGDLAESCASNSESRT